MSLMHRLTCGFEELSLSLMGFEGNVKGHCTCFDKLYFSLNLFMLLLLRCRQHQLNAVFLINAGSAGIVV